MLVICLPTPGLSLDGMEGEEGGVRRLCPLFSAESLPDVGLPGLAFITLLGHSVRHSPGPPG